MPRANDKSLAAIVDAARGHCGPSGVLSFAAATAAATATRGEIVERLQLQRRTCSNSVNHKSDAYKQCAPEGVGHSRPLVGLERAGPQIGRVEVAGWGWGRAQLLSMMNLCVVVHAQRCGNLADAAPIRSSCWWWSLDTTSCGWPRRGGAHASLTMICPAAMKCARAAPARALSATIIWLLVSSAATTISARSS